jgi:hypothetical protein
MIIKRTQNIKMVFMLLICFLLILLVLIIIRLSLGENNDSKGLTISLQEIPEDLKSGDLIFSSYKNILGKAVKVWSGSKWTHVGILYKEPITENFYVLEAAEYNNPNFEKGIIKVPIKAWLKLNEDCDITYKKVKEFIDTRKVYASFLKLKEKKLYKIDVSRKTLKRILFPGKENKEITCVEFVVMMLQDMNVMSKNISSSFYSASDLLSLDI